MLLTTQYLEEADQLAERIAVIDHGRVIAAGTGRAQGPVGGEILEVQRPDGGPREIVRSPRWGRLWRPELDQRPEDDDAGPTGRPPS